MNQRTSNQELARWLAATTGSDQAEVVRELEAGLGRRIFVVDELLEAGFEGAELLDYVIRLTGLEQNEALRLIDDRRRRSAPDA